MSTLVPSTSIGARRRAAAALVLGLLAVIAWIASVNRMDGMSMGSRFSVGSLGFFVGFSAALVLAATPWRSKPLTM